MIIGGRSLGDFGMQQSGEMLEGEFYNMLKQQNAEQYIRQGLHEQIAWETASAIADERAEVMRQDAWRSLLFVLLAAGAVWLYSRRKVITRTSVLCVVLAVIVGADLVNVDTRYLNYKSFVEQHTAKVHPTEADKLIMQDKDPAYRVLNLTVSPFNDATTSYFHRSVGGYHGAKLSRYQDVIDHYLNKMDEGVMDMLNVRYLITSPKADGVVERPTANGAAWFVEEINKAESPREALDMLGYELLDECAIVEGGDALEELYDASGKIELVEYAPNRLKYEYTAPEKSFAVFSEVYFPDGWSVTVDGKPANYYAADYILRGMELPAGKHVVEWSFEAPRWGSMSLIMMICSCVVLFFAGGAIYLLLTKRDRDNVKE